VADTMFDRYGGFAKVSRIVSSFYGEVLGSDTLSPYFDDVDMPRLIDHQTKFMATLLGGPASFSNEHIQRVHVHLGIDDEAMDEMKIVLRDTLDDHDFDESDISAVVAAFEAYRPLVVVHNAS
jgi:hemoglobin